jgi:hypothetical protein
MRSATRGCPCQEVIEGLADGIPLGGAPPRSLALISRTRKSDSYDPFIVVCTQEYMDIQVV